MSLKHISLWMVFLASGSVWAQEQPVDSLPLSFLPTLGELSASSPHQGLQVGPVPTFRLSGGLEFALSVLDVIKYRDVFDMAIADPLFDPRTIYAQTAFEYNRKLRFHQMLGQPQSRQFFSFEPFY
ncbi:MAG: hypothetical protein AAFW89_10620 [Bacteroidota bacterium]